ncbi:MAG: MASE1 domain-containing protein [Gemmatimonadales bacterium]
MPSRNTPYLLQVGGLAAIYLLTARLGQSMALVQGHVPTLWPASGIAVAAIALLGTRVWPGIWLGSFANNFLFFSAAAASDTATTMALAVGIATGTTTMALTARLIPRLIQGPRVAIQSPRDVLAWTVGAGFAAATISATAGTIVEAAGGLLPVAPAIVWRTWWLADLTGIVLLTPAILLWAQHGRLHFRRGQETESLLAAFALAIICFAVFGAAMPRAMAPYLLAAPLLFLSYTALRFGRRVTATCAVVIGGVAIWSTATGHGPLRALARPDALLALQAFLDFGAILGLLLASAVAQTRRHNLDEAPNTTPAPVPLDTLAIHRAPTPRPVAGPPALSAGASGADLDAVLAALAAPVYLLSRETRAITRCNDAFASAIGLGERAAAEGQSLFDLFPPALAMIAADRARQVFQTGEPSDQRERWEPASGESRDYDVHREAIRSADGTVIALLAQARPVA